MCEASPGGGFRVRTGFEELPAAGIGVDNILSGFAGLTPIGAKSSMLPGSNAAIRRWATSPSARSSCASTIVSPSSSHEITRWGDERLFQTARMINIVILMKLVVEDYINHILGHQLFRLDHEFAEEQHWYRANWIALEFDLLYRWHGLCPDKILVGGASLLRPTFATTTQSSRSRARPARRSGIVAGGWQDWSVQHARLPVGGRVPEHQDVARFPIAPLQ